MSDKPQTSASYWQRGFIDGYNGQAMNLPNPLRADCRDRENSGYRNGLALGRKKRAAEHEAGAQSLPLQVVLPLRPDHRADLGMYARASTGVQIGDFNIRPQREGYVWIERSSGEGAEFLIPDVEAAIGAFYDKNF